MEKEAIRERTWDDLESSGTARFPVPPHGRIPNYVDAEAAADRLTETDAWADARVIKSNPDSPQLPVRRRALTAGKTVYVAVPRLAEERPFLELDPEGIDDVDAATTISGCAEYGRPVAPEDVPAVDLIVAGSVAVTEDGARIGKGEGYSDLEYAILSAFDRVDETTTVVTTVHERQVVEDAPAPDEHDVPLDLVVTPDRTIETETPHGRPTDIVWEDLDEERLDEIPVLDRLHGSG